MIGLTPDITEAAAIRHGVLRLRFADGLSGELEILDRMRGPVFDRARTPQGFAQVRVDPETGTVVWPGGDRSAGSCRMCRMGRETGPRFPGGPVASALRSGPTGPCRTRGTGRSRGR